MQKQSLKVRMRRLMEQSSRGTDEDVRFRFNSQTFSGPLPRERHSQIKIKTKAQLLAGGSWWEWRLVPPLLRTVFARAKGTPPYDPETPVLATRPAKDKRFSPCKSCKVQNAPMPVTPRAAHAAVTVNFAQLTHTAAREEGQEERAV